MDWLIQAAVRAVKGRTIAIPWVFFLVTAVLTASGAVVPGAVAIVAPIALGFAIQYGINPVLMGLFVINGATAGGFSPISVFGSIVNGVVEREDLAENAMLLFASSFIFNFLLCIVVFFLFGGRQLLGHRVEPGETVTTTTARGASSATSKEGEGRRPGRRRWPAVRRPPRRRTCRSSTATRSSRSSASSSLIVVALAFEVDVGFVAFSIAAVLMLISPKARKGAVEKVAWSTVLLICGIVMYVGLLEEIGTIDWLGEQVATLDRALLAALLICYVGAVVSAFASTTGILGALIPLAVPFLETGAVGAVGLIIALSISSSVVDSSPFSTSGALTVANTPEEHRERVFKRLMQWGMSMVVIAPPIAWLVFVVPGWL